LSLSYTPYAAATVALGNALEKYIACPPSMNMIKPIKRFYQNRKDLVSFAIHLNYLRNNASHPQSARVFTEHDTRLAFLLALWSFNIVSGNKAQAQSILNIQTSYSWKVLARRVLSYIRKKANSCSDIPLFNRVEDFEAIKNATCDSDFNRTLLSLLMRPVFGVIGERDYEQVLLTSTFNRFVDIISDGELFVPHYSDDEKEMKSPKIIEILPVKDGWELPDGSLFKTSDRSKSGHRFPCDVGDYTQAFLCKHDGSFVPWGPSIPYGEYSKDQLREMLDS
jgi:hypothetical protein